ncbi:23S rRNA (uracil(1939)-C(5))-methyltransferaseRlmD [Striga asiatica]|uniref:23S rRNA (Uracil(1939)-C(5))-methyltransferaseRlmD n=1 Tax=Striga asiatica TaxID=4170 RepID=A0A5A7RBP3_STRAF|nr:23S rRNA (uracil(1939)-C(5))-methyltransferaseRlmD [Striga asiatica]
MLFNSQFKTERRHGKRGSHLPFSVNRKETKPKGRLGWLSALQKARFTAARCECASAVTRPYQPEGSEPARYILAAATARARLLVRLLAGRSRLLLAWREN